MQLQIDPDGIALAKLVQAMDPCDKRILEVGWGDGRITSVLSGRSKRLTAIDVDVHPICHEGARWVRTDFLAASGESLPFSGLNFDVVVFSQSLHHQNSRKAIQEAVGVLRPNGRIVILEPVAGTELEAVCSLFENEIERRLEAIYAIFGSGLEIAYQDTINTIWRFRDRYELLQWLFDYYKTPRDPDLEARVSGMLGEKSTRVPLELGETLLLICLRPRQLSK